MERFDEGLRCQDVHAGLRNVDPNSGTLTALAETQLIGMAASLAALVRGQDVIVDAQALRAVAAEQLDVNQFAFDSVIAALADVGFVEGVQRWPWLPSDGRSLGAVAWMPGSGTRFARFSAQVPLHSPAWRGSVSSKPMDVIAA